MSTPTEPLAAIEPNPHGPFAALRKMVPQSEVIRYLFVGGFNTVFALALYWALLHLFQLWMPTQKVWIIADAALFLSTPLSITVAFLCYKRFVFRTQGNYLKEWLRCFAVYSVSFPMGLVILPLATQLMTAILHSKTYAPYAAGLVNSAVIATYSYFGHKKFSFKQ